MTSAAQESGLGEAGRIAVGCERITKTFGSGQSAVTALDDVSLNIDDGAFFTLLGPSGCGKTTLLRLIAGFEQPTQGAIRLFGDDIAGLPPHRRPVNTVFQQYALFPHMTVRENVTFGLKMLGRPASEANSAAQRALDLVKLQHLADRKSSQLSGGQQQRVALARALAPNPKVLLLDEPLSALDLKLRQAMRSELKRLQRETGITFIFVTHDQEEALTMSDRIAVMSEGEVQQVGGPREIYDAPVNRFVADFIGDTNFLEVEIERIEGGEAQCRLGGGQRIVCPAVGDHPAGTKATIVLRPEKIVVSPGAGADSDLDGVVQDAMYLGTDTTYQVALGDGTTITVRAQNATAEEDLAAGSAVRLSLQPGALRMLLD